MRIACEIELNGKNLQAAWLRGFRAWLKESTLAARQG